MSGRAAAFNEHQERATCIQHTSIRVDCNIATSLDITTLVRLHTSSLDSSCESTRLIEVEAVLTTLFIALRDQAANTALMTIVTRARDTPLLFHASLVFLASVCIDWMMSRGEEVVPTPFATPLQGFESIASTTGLCNS